ncbi:MAG TPA: hypothetical protein VL360_06330 [Gammaproteobacteria bacterium]|jgi:hypothetical protein|nr:hypothetical protein [Gammaproteobacteria bacterium]
MKKIILVSSLALALSSCAIEPMMFGMPESQFKALPANQQNMVIKSYNERQRIKAENEVANNVIHAVSTLSDTALKNKQ